MEPWVVIGLKYFALSLAASTLTFFTGLIILRALSSLITIEGFYQKIFISFCLGVFFMVMLSSCIATNFKTISTGLFLSGLALIYQLYHYKLRKSEIFTIRSLNFQISSKIAIIRILGLFALALFFFCWQAYCNLKNGDLSFVLPDVNCVYWADLCETIWRTGQENTYQAGNLVNEDFFGPSPYHYFEMWLTAAFSWVLQIKPVFSMHLVVFPMFFLMMVLGAYSILETYASPIFLKRLFAFGLLFIGGIPFIKDYYAEGLQWLTIIESPFFCVKTSHHFWIAMIGFLFIINNFFTVGIIVFYSLIFVSASLVPAIFSGGLLFIILSRIFKIQPDAEILQQGIALILFMLFFFLFYSVVGNNNFSFRTYLPLLYYTDLNPILMNGFDFYYLKVMLAELIVRIFKIPFENLFILSPFIAIFLFTRKQLTDRQTFFRPFIFILSIYAAALVCYGFFYRMHDSIQFYDNIFFLILAFLTVSLLPLIANPVRKDFNIALHICLVALLVFKFSLYLYNKTTYREVFSNMYSDCYITEIIHSDSNVKRPGVFFKNVSGEDRITGRNAQLLDRIGGYTCFGGWLPPVDLSIVEMNNWDTGHWGELEKSIVKTSPFYQFIEDQKSTGHFISLSQSQLDFIEQYKIGYMIVEKNYVLSPLLDNKIDRTITDAKSGERFIFLK